MSKADDKIVKCATRMVEKLNNGRCQKYNGEYLKPVQVEIDRMRNHCADKEQAK